MFAVASHEARYDSECDGNADGKNGVAWDVHEERWQGWHDRDDTSVECVKNEVNFGHAKRRSVN